LIADPWFWAVALPAVAITGISKGGTGGGAAVATPLMALVIPPAAAAAIMLPVLCVMDLAGVRGFLAWTLYPKKRFMRKPGAAAGWFWGTLSGFTSFITHAGGPPAMVWLIPQKLDKEAFVATSLVFFAALNYAKILPYLWLGLFDRAILATSLALVPVGVGCIYVGRSLQRRIDTRWFYRIIYVLLFVTGTRLLYDGLTGL
jgi:uncharacterized membrane protein YfcA